MKIGLPVGLRCARHVSAVSRLGGRARLTRPTGDFHGNPAVVGYGEVVVGKPYGYALGLLE